jgi:hypothetical protein
MASPPRAASSDQHAQVRIPAAGKPSAVLRTRPAGCMRKASICIHARQAKTDIPVRRPKGSCVHPFFPPPVSPSRQAKPASPHQSPPYLSDPTSTTAHRTATTLDRHGCLVWYERPEMVCRLQLQQHSRSPGPPPSDRFAVALQVCSSCAPDTDTTPSPPCAAYIPPRQHRPPRSSVASADGSSRVVVEGAASAKAHQVDEEAPSTRLTILLLSAHLPTH